MRKYTALIMDLKESRKYSPENRNKIQTYILKVADILNTAFKGSLEKEVSFSAGDELQGLFGRVEAAYLYFRLFSMLVSPVEIRAGIGVGEWDVVIKNAPSTAQDGSAYHNARKAINATKESLGYSVLLYSGGKNDLIANSLFNSTAIIIGKQSEYQNKVMLLSELLYPINAYGIINVDKLRQAVNLVAQNEKTADNNLLYIDTFENKSKDITEVDDNFFVTEGRVRGLPMQLAEIMGVTRQSVDKTIKTANIYEARNLAVATLKYLKQLGEV
jgi:hypothetical protein